MLQNRAIFLEKIEDYKKIDKKLLEDKNYLVFSFDIDVYNFLKEKNKFLKLLMNILVKMII